MYGLSKHEACVGTISPAFFIVWRTRYAASYFVLSLYTSSPAVTDRLTFNFYPSSAI